MLLHAALILAQAAFVQLVVAVLVAMLLGTRRLTRVDAPSRPEPRTTARS